MTSIAPAAAKVPAFLQDSASVFQPSKAAELFKLLEQKKAPSDELVKAAKAEGESNHFIASVGLFNSGMLYLPVALGSLLAIGSGGPLATAAAGAAALASAAATGLLHNAAVRHLYRAFGHEAPKLPWEAATKAAS